MNVNYNNGEIRIFSYIFQTKLHSISKDDIQVFVINLDRTPERYEKVKDQLRANNIKHERFSAVDGYNLEIIHKQTGDRFLGKDLKTGKTQILPNEHYTISCPSADIKYFSKYFTDYNVTRTLTAGEFGCYCSHREIWNSMVLNNVKYALILEDDITFSPNFEKKFTTLINNLPYQWDIIYLYVATDPQKNTLTVLNNSNIKKFQADNYGITLTAGYLINLNAAKKLFELSENFSLAIDDLMSEHVNNKKIQAYKTSEHYLTAPVGVNPEDSTIFDMGRPHF